NIQVRVTDLDILNGAAIAVSSQNGNGQAGNIDIEADTVDLTNASITAETNNGGFTSPANILFRDLSTLSVFNSLISSSTDSGLAGSVNAFASDFISLQGEIDSLTGLPITATGLFAQARQGGNAGSVSVITPELTIQNGAAIAVSSSNGAGTAGNLTINTPLLRLDNQGRISAETDRGGAVSPANIILQGLSQLSVTNDSSISASTQGGVAGSISLNVNEAPIPTVVVNRSQIAAQASAASGNAGSITLNANTIDLQDNGKILTSNLSGNTASNISFQNTNTFTIVDQSSVEASTQTGTAGSITLNTFETPAALLQLRNNSRINAEATGAGGRSGNITLFADTIDLQDNSSISITTTSGEGGSLFMDQLDTVTVANSLLTAATDTGIAGDITLTFRNSELTLTGQNSAGRGGIIAEATGAGGQAGNIIINMPGGDTFINQGAEITVSSPQGIAGGITLDAYQIFLDRGLLKAETGQTPLGGSGATINLNVGQRIVLDNRSQITASAFNQANGGNVSINTLFLIAFPTDPDGSDIIANAEGGDGGFISLTATGIFGIRFRSQLTPLNDLTVSSQAGSSGIVVLDTPDVDPSQGLTAIPINLTDPSSLINDQCSVSTSNQQSEFTITGSGGLPNNPADSLQRDEFQEDFAPELFDANVSSPSKGENSSSNPAESLDNVRAQGVKYVTSGLSSGCGSF
ncbi:MAG: beta strand repeat-containing protein, partial [Prochlorotrichaceae cyanobacterium]